MYIKNKHNFEQSKQTNKYMDKSSHKKDTHKEIHEQIEVYTCR